MKQILIVCTANICRSPMAMGLLRARLAEDGLSDEVTVASAGIRALEGQPATQFGVQLLAERQIDIADHRAQAVTVEALVDADLILAMEEAHRRVVFDLAPQQLRKVYLFSELARQHHDIADPYGGSRAEYAATIAELDRILDAGWYHLLHKLDL